MRTTIDSAGRVVIPKPVRDAMGLLPGRAIDMVFTNGRIEIELAPALVEVHSAGGLPRLTAKEGMPALTAEVVRDTLETTRR